MKKTHTKYVCQSCGYESPRWIGRCVNCGEWNSFVEEIITSSHRPSPHAVSSGRPVPLEEIPPDPEPRTSTSIPELDRVLGGGIVAGSVVLVGGDPGIGKSTLMLQMAAAMDSTSILYVTGEESVRQINLRAARLETRPQGKVSLLAETNLEAVEEQIDAAQPGMVIVDSVQTMWRPALESAPGTVSQVREATAMFVRIAKSKGTPVFLIGHITKEGVIAGPKVVEHMVDTVLQFEGERSHAYRILRAVKNRFGSTNEIGIFEMHECGLREVRNPSAALLSERKTGTAGSIVVPAIEGTRPILVEMQALVAPASYGVPQRSTTGFDARRLQMLLAVLEKRAGLHVGQHDVFVNVAGGVRVDEPAADLGMAMAIASCLRDIPLNAETVVAGEIGLGGEIRSIGHLEQRIAESGKLGFKRIILPRLSSTGRRPAGGLDLLEVDTIHEAIAHLA